MPPSCITKYPTDCEIWELNSRYFVCYIRTRVHAKYIPKWDVFCTDTFLGAKYDILGVQRPYCVDNRAQGPLGGGDIGCWYQIK